MNECTTKERREWAETGIVEEHGTKDNLVEVHDNGVSYHMKRIRPDAMMLVGWS